MQELGLPSGVGEAPSKLMAHALVQGDLHLPKRQRARLERVASQANLQALGADAEVDGSGASPVEEDRSVAREVALVVVCLLTKPEGRFRPIGLLPFTPRLWMREKQHRHRVASSKPQPIT